MSSNKLGSKDIAEFENITQRAANYMKLRDGFPEVEWIGRTWRVDGDSYKNWKLRLSEGVTHKNA